MGLTRYLTRLGEALAQDFLVPIQGRAALKRLPMAVGAGMVVGGGLPYLAGADPSVVALGAALGGTISGFSHPIHYIDYINELRSFLAMANLPPILAEGIPLVESLKAPAAIGGGLGLASAVGKLVDRKRKEKALTASRPY